MALILTEKPHGRPSVRPDNETLLMLYSGMTAPELAEKYGVSADTVRRWVRLARKEMRDNV